MNVWQRALRGVSAFGVAAVVACSLVVDPEALQAGCGERAKPCVLPSGQLGCVDVTDPAYGCATSTCVACTLPSASETCGVDGRCSVGTCDRGFGNCNGQPVDGCESNLEEDYDNCTVCGHSCDEELRRMPRTLTARCRAMRCQVEDCEEGFADCDGAAGNGCERELAAEDCGLCGGCPSGTTCNVETLTCE